MGGGGLIFHNITFGGTQELFCLILEAEINESHTYLNVMFVLVKFGKFFRVKILTKFSICTHEGYC